MYVPTRNSECFFAVVSTFHVDLVRTPTLPCGWTSILLNHWCFSVLLRFRTTLAEFSLAGGVGIASVLVEHVRMGRLVCVVGPFGWCCESLMAEVPLIFTIAIVPL